MPKPNWFALVAPWTVKPSMTTSLAVTSNGVLPPLPVPSTTDSVEDAPVREAPRASTPCWAPSRVSALLMVTLSGYVPASARRVSPAWALATAS